MLGDKRRPEFLAVWAGNGFSLRADGEFILIYILSAFNLVWNTTSTALTFALHHSSYFTTAAGVSLKKKKKKEEGKNFEVIHIQHIHTLWAQLCLSCQYDCEQEHMQWNKMGIAINNVLIILNGGKTNEKAAAKSMQCKISLLFNLTNCEQFREGSGPNHGEFIQCFRADVCVSYIMFAPLKPLAQSRSHCSEHCSTALSTGLDLSNWIFS